MHFAHSGLLRGLAFFDMPLRQAPFEMAGAGMTGDNWPRGSGHRKSDRLPNIRVRPAVPGHPVKRMWSDRPTYGVAASWPKSAGWRHRFYRHCRFRRGNISGRCRPKTVAGVGCADVAGLTGAADGAETGMVTCVAAGAVRAAGGISTSRGVGIAVVCAAAALATATAASTAA